MKVRLGWIETRELAVPSVARIDWKQKQWARLGLYCQSIFVQPEPGMVVRLAERERCILFLLSQALLSLYWRGWRGLETGGGRRRNLNPNLTKQKQIWNCNKS